MFDHVEIVRWKESGTSSSKKRLVSTPGSNRNAWRSFSGILPLPGDQGKNGQTGQKGNLENKPYQNH